MRWHPADPEPSPGESAGRCRDWTGGAYRLPVEAHGEGTVQTTNVAHAGLRRRNRVDHIGRDESRHLEPLHRIIDSGRTPAEEMLEKFHGAWRGSVEPAYNEYAF